MTQTFIDIDNDALDGLIERVTEAKEHELALSPEDCQLLLNALMTLANLQENMASKDVTIHKLKKSMQALEYSEQFRTALSKISEQTSSSLSLNSLYEELHKIVNRGVEGLAGECRVIDPERIAARRGR